MKQEDTIKEKDGAVRLLLSKFALHADISLREAGSLVVGGAWPPFGVAPRGVVSGIEVLCMVLDVFGHEGADEEVAVVITLQEQQRSS